MLRVQFTSRPSPRRQMRLRQRQWRRNNKAAYCNSLYLEFPVSLISFQSPLFGLAWRFLPDCLEIFIITFIYFRTFFEPFYSSFSKVLFIIFILQQGFFLSQMSHPECPATLKFCGHCHSSCLDSSVQFVANGISQRYFSPQNASATVGSSLLIVADY